jgi:hypothetical protein
VKNIKDIPKFLFAHLQIVKILPVAICRKALVFDSPHVILKIIQKPAIVTNKIKGKAEQMRLSEQSLKN